MNKTWKNTFIRFLIFQFILVGFILSAFIYYGIRVKSNQAEIITASIRNSFILGDNRSISDILSQPVQREYTAIKVIKANSQVTLSFGNEKLDKFQYLHVIKILADPNENKSIIGEIYFYFDLRLLIKNAIGVWALVLVLSIPFFYFERRKLLKAYELESRIKEAELAKKITEQVSHDIRSPLAVLQMKVKDLKGIDDTSLSKINQAITRIDYIANDLLKNKEAKDKTNLVRINLGVFLENLIQDKKDEFQNKLDIKFKLIENAHASFDEVALLRVISNLINNSIEAIDANGIIQVILSKEDEFAKIEIIDNGKGIPEDIIQSIGQRGFSFGKKGSKSGSGLGIFSAIETIDSFGGTLKISSKENQGTSITLLIKAALDLSGDFYNFVYIEDDELLRTVWIEKAKKVGVKLLALSASAELENFWQNLDQESTIFYIDYELGGDRLNGVKVAEKLFQLGCKNLIIASGHPPEKFKEYSWLKSSNKRCPF